MSRQELRCTHVHAYTLYRVGEVEEVARVDHRRVGVVDERECAVLAQQHVLEMPISRGEEEVEERRAHHGAPVDPPQLVDHRARARAVRILLVGPLRARAQQHVGRDALRQLGHHRRPPRRRRLLGRAVGVRLNHAELRHPLASDEAVEQAAVGTDGVDEARVLALVLEHLAAAQLEDQLRSRSVEILLGEEDVGRPSNLALVQLAAKGAPPRERQQAAPARRAAVPRHLAA